MYKIICIGSTSKDIFFPTKDGIILETPDDVTSQRKLAFELGAKYQVTERHETLGGCAANVARGLAKLGENCECYSKIGNDELGKWIRKSLTEGNIGIEALEIENGCKSDLSMILVDMLTAERTVFSDRDANDKLIIFPEKLKSAHWIFISSLNGDWQNNLKEILSIAQEKNIRIAFNPGQKNIKSDIHAVMYAITRSEILFVNKDEAIEIVGGLDDAIVRELLENEEHLSKVLYKLGAKVVIITDGANGAWAYDGSNLIHAKAIMQKAVDTTGAGDAFTSGFFAAYLKRHNLKTALQWGIANSSNSVKEYGGQKGLLDENEITMLAQKVVIV